MIQGTTFGVGWSASLRRTSESELRGWLEFAQRSADVADSISLAAFRHDPVASSKVDGSFVTDVDLRIEQVLRDAISARFPGHRVIGEEFGGDDVSDSPRWYIDPIDGTHNFMRGMPNFGTLIAVECGEELQLGVVSAPALRQRWFAARGIGAWSVGGSYGPTPRALRVTSVDSIADAHLLYRSLRDMEASRVAAGFDTLRRDVERATGLGDFWGYALVADGAAEAMVEQGLGPWDLAAPWVVVEEAGGRVTDFDDRRSLERGEGCATNGRLHKEILVRLRGEQTH